MTAAERAAALTQRLLAFARQQPLSPQPLDVNKMIVGMSDLLRSTLGELIHVETVAAAGLWTVHADTQQLENAILNIAINARDAMPDGGKLTIETANVFLDEDYCRRNPEIQPGQYAMIAVTDTGVGMAPRCRRAGIRSVLHHQSRRQGHRAWPEPSLWLRQAIARPYQSL